MKARRRDERPKLDTLGGGGKGGKRGPRLPRSPRAAAGQVIEQVVTKPQRVEPDALRGPGHREQLRPPDPPLDLGQLDTDAARTRHSRTLPTRTPTRSLSPWQAIRNHPLLPRRARSDRVPASPSWLRVVVAGEQSTDIGAASGCINRSTPVRDSGTVARRE